LKTADADNQKKMLQADLDAVIVAVLANQLGCRVAENACLEAAVTVSE